MPQPDHMSALPVADPEALAEDLRELFALCTEKLGNVPAETAQFRRDVQRADAGAVGHL